MMVQKYIANNNAHDIKKLTAEIVFLQEQIHQLKNRIDSIQQHCKHIFLETSVMRKCQKCGYTESTYY
ncbi:hypothetical protein AM1BK_25300 [Neobacillus kokaensis]|uniref:Transposase n=1 Tax=Neobacillus kokaensis TaxID=2759023 RepID=A0ABQ3N2S8_9BACI|nr:hypothetical protein AM1BK_25300 [Neobacillus kokaensis]